MAKRGRKPGPQKQALTVRLTVEQYQELHAEAERRGSTPTAVATMLLIRALDK